MNIKELESEESPGKFDVVGDESLEDKDKLINCSDNKIAGSKQLVFRHQRNPVPNLVTSPSLNVLFQFQKMADQADMHSYQIFERFKCNLL